MQQEGKLNRTATVVLIEVRTGKTASEFYLSAIAEGKSARAIARELRERYNIPVSHTTVRGHLKQLRVSHQKTGWIREAA